MRYQGPHVISLHTLKCILWLAFWGGAAIVFVFVKNIRAEEADCVFVFVFEILIAFFGFVFAFLTVFCGVYYGERRG